METLNFQRKCNYWSLDRAVTLSAVFALLYCNYVAAQFSTRSTSPSGRPDNLQQDVSCSQLCYYDEWFQRAQCDERNLKTIPSSEGCENSHILELQRNQVTNISEDSFIGYSQLKTLDLSYNTITGLRPGTFLNTTYLRNIVIDNNYITELQNGTFKGPENHLTRIYLSRNNIVDIHENVFQGLRKLTNIYLSYNKLQSLPSTVFRGLTRLQGILLGHNALHHLEATTFRDLVGLETLSLRNNKLKWLPNGLFHGLSSLRELVLSNNELFTLPSPENLGLVSIHILCIDGNNLTESEDVIPYKSIARDQLDMQNNPYTCDCAFITIQEWCKKMSAENSLQYSVTCTLGDLKYHLDDDLPVSCEHTSTDVVLSTILNEEHTTKSVTPLSNDSAASTASKNYVLHNFPLRHNCSRDTVDKVALAASLYCAVFISIFFVLWVCCKCHSCCCSNQQKTDVIQSTTMTTV